MGRNRGSAGGRSVHSSEWLVQLTYLSCGCADYKLLQKDIEENAPDENFSNAGTLGDRG